MAINTDDPAWRMARFGYDLYGNQTSDVVLADSDGSVEHRTNTEYDGYYHLFPIKVYAPGHAGFVEQASYYGVNAASSGDNRPLSDAWAYWGALAEWCDICFCQ